MKLYPSDTCPMNKFILLVEISCEFLLFISSPKCEISKATEDSRDVQYVFYVLVYWLRNKYHSQVVELTNLNLQATAG